MTNADVRAEKVGECKDGGEGGWSALDAVEHGGENMEEAKT